MSLFIPSPEPEKQQFDPPFPEPEDALHHPNDLLSYGDIKDVLQEAEAAETFARGGRKDRLCCDEAKAG